LSQDFYSFEKVLRELQMQEEELKPLVSEGEIRAFRDQDKMKFKKEDVERWRQGVESDQTLSDDDIPEELVFDEDDADQEVGMATAAIDDDSFLEEEDAPLELEEEPERRRGASARSGAGGRRSRVVVEEPEATEGVLFLSAIIASSVLLLIGLFAALDATQGQPSGLTDGLQSWIKSSFLS